MLTLPGSASILDTLALFHIALNAQFTLPGGCVTAGSSRRATDLRDGVGRRVTAVLPAARVIIVLAVAVGADVTADAVGGRWCGVERGRQKQTEDGSDGERLHCVVGELS